jgi:hypothetical protein
MIMRFLMVFLFTACGSTGKSPDCVDHGQCNEGQACMEGVCADADCLASTECGLGEYCSPAEFTCETGCMDDGDCFAGEECNLENRSCVSYGCRSTELDCAVGEFCDTDANSNTFGECYKDDRNHCKVCDVDRNNCPNGMDCFMFEQGNSCYSDNDCANGWTCDLFADFNFYCHRDRCLSTCKPNQKDSCPSGFSCGDTSGFGDYYCIADCAYLKENGHL